MAALCPYETLVEVSHHAPTVDWPKEVKRTYEAIHISSTSTTILCSMRGNVIESLHDPTTEAYTYLSTSWTLLWVTCR
jgi:hypothetical protein